MTAHRHGSFGWTDVALPDVDAGEVFYSGVFGWRVSDSPGMPYTIFQANGRNVAGMGPLLPEQREQNVPPQWSSYVAVHDVDSIAERAAELGANVLLPPADISEAGRMTYLLDPTGAAIGFWQAGEHRGADVFGVPGAMCWNELATQDVRDARDFYSQLLPWDLTEEHFNGFTYTTILLRGKPTGGMFEMGEGYPDGARSHWITYFAVDDCDASVERVVSLGGAVLREPMDTPFGRVASVADSQGAGFRVIKLTDRADGSA